MFARAGRVVHRGRWTVLVLALVAAVLVVPLGLGLYGRMPGGFEDPLADSATSARWNDEWYGDTPDVVVLYRHPDVKVNDPRYKKAVHDSLRALPARYVRRMVTYWSTGSKDLRSKDEHATYALITLKDGTQTDAYAAIAERVRRVRNLQVSVGGSVPLGKELDERAAADLVRAGGISMAVLLVLFVVAFGNLVAAGVPLVVGLVVVLGAPVLLVDVSVFSMSVVAMLGFGLAVDYSLVVLKAFREEIGGGGSTERAVVRTVASAGRTVAFSGVTVAVAMLGLSLLPQAFPRAIGLGAAAVVLVATGVAVVVLPAVLGVIGPRVAFRPLPHLVAVAAVLLSLALPFLYVGYGDVDHRVLPADSESRRVAETLDHDFARNALTPIDVHVRVERPFADGIPGPVTPLDVEPLVRRLERLPGVTGVDVTGLSQDHGAVRLAVRHSADPGSDAARHLVTLIRGLPPEPNVRAVVVGGPAAARLDLLDALAATLPWMALAAAAVLVPAALRSVGPAKRWSPTPAAVPPPPSVRPYRAPEERAGWVKVGESRTRVVRADPDGRGWTWAELDE